MPTRCSWAGSDPEMIAYHGDEWGRPSHDDAHLFEMITLEGAQAGLSWSTILHKRAGYRALFSGFDAEKVARFSPAKIEKLMLDPSIVRNRMKIESTVANAKAILAVRKEFGSLDAYLWGLNGPTRVDRFRSLADLPSQTPESKAMSKALLKRGFRFVGPTICYALMQAVGMVDDHMADCFRATAARHGGAPAGRSRGAGVR